MRVRRAVSMIRENNEEQLAGKAEGDIGIT